MPRRKVTRLRKFCGQLAGHSSRQAERVTQAALMLVESCLAAGQGELDMLAFQACLGELLDRHRDSLSTESDSKYSQAKKDVHVDDTEVFAFKVARFYEAFYALVGLDGLANRVRRSSHRASGGDDNVETPEAAGDAGEREEPEPASEPSETGPEPES